MAILVMIPMNDIPLPAGTNYEIRIEGHLGVNRRRSFEDFQVELSDDGQTIITGIVQDQAALHAVLTKIRDLGVILVSVNRKGAGDGENKSERGMK